jgi:hypothetical protein
MRVRIAAAVLRAASTSPGGAPDKAVERAEGRILLVGDAPGRAPQSFPRQLDKSLEVSLPELRGTLRVALLEQPKPDRDGAHFRFRHLDLPAPGASCRVVIKHVKS